MRVFPRFSAWEVVHYRMIGVQGSAVNIQASFDKILQDAEPEEEIIGKQ